MNLGDPKQNNKLQQVLSPEDIKFLNQEIDLIDEKNTLTDNKELESPKGIMDDFKGEDIELLDCEDHPKINILEDSNEQYDSEIYNEENEIINVNLGEPDPMSVINLKEGNVEEGDVEEIELVEDSDVEEIELVEDSGVEEIELVEDSDVEEIELVEDSDVEEGDVEEIELVEDSDVEEGDVEEIELVEEGDEEVELVEESDEEVELVEESDEEVELVEEGDEEVELVEESDEEVELFEEGDEEVELLEESDEEVELLEESDEEVELLEESDEEVELFEEGDDLIQNINNDLNAPSKIIEPEPKKVNELHTDKSVDYVLTKYREKILVFDFYADWCGPCKRIAPDFEKMSMYYENFLFFKINVDKCPVASKTFKIKAMPTFIYLNGKDAYKTEGANLKPLISHLSKIVKLKIDEDF